MKGRDARTWELIFAIFSPEDFLHRQLFTPVKRSATLRAETELGSEIEMAPEGASRYLADSSGFQIRQTSCACAELVGSIAEDCA